MNRRGFIARVLSAVAAGAVLDVDKLLWVPGAKTILIPKELPLLHPCLQMGDVFTIKGLGQFVVTEDIAFSERTLYRLRKEPALRMEGNMLGQTFGGYADWKRKRAYAYS